MGCAKHGYTNHTFCPACDAEGLAEVNRTTPHAPAEGLPELPEPAHHIRDGRLPRCCKDVYTADQMRAYALAAQPPKAEEGHTTNVDGAVNWLVRCRRTGRVVWSDPSRSTAEGYARHIAHRMPDNTLDTEVIPFHIAALHQQGRGEAAFSAPADLHPASVSLVARFATAMAEKLANAQRKYGYTNGWQHDDWMDECREDLRQHVEKGDPLDVANYCAFLWHHGESTAQPSPKPPAQGDVEAVGVLEMILDGRISGRISEWPQIKPAIRSILRQLAKGGVQVDEIAKDRSAAYDRIDRFLRNNLCDSDYAEYSESLEIIYGGSHV